LFNWNPIRCQLHYNILSELQLQLSDRVSAIRFTQRCLGVKRTKNVSAAQSSGTLTKSILGPPAGETKPPKGNPTQFSSGHSSQSASFQLAEGYDSDGGFSECSDVARADVHPAIVLVESCLKHLGLGKLCASDDFEVCA
jgi:hypothetical protein